MASTPSIDRDDEAIRALHRGLIAAWNQRNPDDYAARFLDDGSVVGFDGSQMEGRAEIAAQLRAIFADHVTAPYVAKIEEVRFLAPGVAVLRAIVGMIPPGQKDLNPAANALQTLVAVERDGQWHIALFQNTPAQFHGRPELVEQMTNELRELL
ncbi:MAG: SgcJ/EcaC family oxidoreductase [Thermomicrobiales bacterium]|nr:SgcJ/EcaC family oxidoreductase [Thermomicrobiales bacterium]